MAHSSYIIQPTRPHTHTVIFLHGRGSNASEFCSEIFETQDSSGRYFTEIFPSIKWVFPCARRVWSDLDQEELHQWFNMTNVQDAQQNPELQRSGLVDTKAQLLEIIEEEWDCVPERRVILAGISQGCAAALYTLLSTGVRIGGFFGLCGWLPFADELTEYYGLQEWIESMRATPTLLQHCEDDSTVPIANGKTMYECLKDMGMNVRWQQFSQGGHWLNEPEGMDGLVRFIQSIMEISAHQLTVSV